jgi:hypothetical protein
VQSIIVGIIEINNNSIQASPQLKSNKIKKKGKRKAQGFNDIANDVRAI